MVELTAELDLGLRPDRLEAAQELVATSAALAERYAYGVVLVLRPAQPQPHVEPSTGEEIERGELLGQHDRLVVRHEQHAGAQTHAAGGAGYVGASEPNGSSTPSKPCGPGCPGMGG